MGHNFDTNEKNTLQRKIITINPQSGRNATMHLEL
jgi:hypothetical protein